MQKYVMIPDNFYILLVVYGLETFSKGCFVTFTKVILETFCSQKVYFHFFQVIFPDKSI